MTEKLIEETMEVKAPEGAMKVLVKRPLGEEGRLAVIFHDGPGVRPSVHEVARRVARLGFVAVVPDLYYRISEFPTFGGPPGSPEFDEMLTAIRSVATADVAADTKALLKAAAQAGWGSEARVCLGFCVGASALLKVMSMSGSPFEAGAAFHPTFCVTDAPDSPHLAVADVKGQLFVAFGGADEVAPPETNAPLMDQLDRLGPRASYVVHPGARHGFMMADAHYDETAAALSWEAAERLFGSEPRASG